MVRSASAASLLNLLLPQWQELLQGWAIDDSISRAATEALRLNAEPPLLAQLVNRWAAGDFSDLPQVVLLPASSMPGAAGAYAISTGTIYLNADWLTTAAPQQALAVLTEELGHHLDNLLNTEDTPGDEGELFAARLKGDGLISAQQRQRLLGENDLGSVVVDGKVLAVELAATVQVALSSVATVTEDGPESLHVVFSRTGDVSAALTVNFVVGGSAAFSSDYDQRGATSYTTSSGSVTFAAGSSVAILSLDPRSDVVRDGDETVILSLAEDAGYVIGSRSSVTGTILDNDVSPGVVVRAQTNVTSPGTTQGENINGYSFAALKADGSVVTWGNSLSGGDSTGVAGQLSSGVTQIFSTGSAFAALKVDGSVVTWGDSTYGADSSGVAGQLSSGVTQIFTNGYSFAALKEDASVVTWGHLAYGGNSSGLAGLLSSGVSQISSTIFAFAALKTDGSVVTWGNSLSGGDSTGVAGQLSSGVTQIFSTGSAFAALKVDGSVVTWGDSTYGADSSGVAGQLSSGVTQIFTNGFAFAALKDDFSVVTWGYSPWGGDSSGVSAQLNSNVVKIFATGSAFAALKSDGSVVTWGSAGSGGDTSGVTDQISSGITQIFSTNDAFAALKVDGSVVTWGASSWGGDSSGVASQLSSGVTKISSAGQAFAALKADGSLVTWGNSFGGGNSNDVADQLSSGVTQIFSTHYAFAALKADGSVVTWGEGWGGDSSGVASQLTNVVAFANPFTDDRLVPGVLPSITLAVSPASPAEDGPETLTFTFTRTGPTDSELTVNYSVGGTATLGIDYSGIDASPATKTVTFAAGAATATVTVDPAADHEFEVDESVTLTLVAGTGYTIGTATAEEGMIANDDALPTTVQVALSGVATVTEDGPESLHVVFSRTGDVSAALTVNFSVGGSAGFGSDYDQRGATSYTTSSGSVTFVAGSNVAIFSIDPHSDVVSDGVESVILTLAEGDGYLLGSRSSVTGIILDNDVEPGVVVRAAIPVTDPQRTRGEVRNLGAFAVIKADGSVVTWGNPSFGGDSSRVADQLCSGVVQIFSARMAFAALKTDGSVVSWGGSTVGNLGGSSVDVAELLSSGVIQVFSTDYAFAALKTNGSVVTWDYSPMGGSGGDSAAIADQINSGVTQIFSTQNAFAALKADGSVVTWGNSYFGGESSGVAGKLSSAVTQIISTGSAFAALKADGSVVTWGNSEQGGDSSGVAVQLSSGVIQIYSTSYAFAALKADGSVVTWGSSSSGGTSSGVADQLGSGVTHIVSTDGAFAALKANGSVVTWGLPDDGGDSSAVAGALNFGVVRIFSSAGAFAALKADGSVVTWGLDLSGGHSSGVSGQLSSGVTQIFSNQRTFAALKADGSVVTWGDSSWGNLGGDSSAVATQLSSGVTQIFSTASAFAALKADGTVVTWGDTYYGGNSSGVASQLTNVVAFANPHTDDRLVPPALPSITLAVSPASVTEDGSDPLTFTFTRTGPTDSELTVNYSVGGTATLGTDYSGITAEGEVKTVTFATGVSTAIVTVEATPDSESEPDETVELTLASGCGYTIGTQAAVSGVITKDDSSPSTVQVALSSVATVTEDGPESLHVVFSRTGDVSAALTVNFVVGGSAAFSSDYDQRGATSFTTSSGSVTFAAGSSVAILSLDPRSDAIRDGDETVILSLAEGASYALGSRSSVKSTILDNDVEPGVVVRAAVPVADPQRGRGEYRADRAFAALRSNGSVVTWGDPTLGGDSSEVASRLSSGIIQVFSTSDAFAALKVDGSVVTWGGYVSPNSWQNANAGNSTAVAAQLSSEVTQIFSTSDAFAALKADGSVVTWGVSGGDSTAVAGQLSSGVIQIFSTHYAFAALKADGSVVAWGVPWAGGDMSGVAAQLSSGVNQIISTHEAFAALKADGSVVTWGNPSLGGNSSGVAGQLSSAVTQIFSTQTAFAALKSDGSVVTWGMDGGGGNSSAVAGQLGSGVTQIFATGGAFAALKADGSVVTWGWMGHGFDISGTVGQLSSGVTQIFSTGGAFAALKADGSVVTWGIPSLGSDSSAVASQLSSGVTQMISNWNSFAALKADGSVITWGIYSGDSSAVASQLSSGVTNIFSTGSAFAALKADGSVVTWGDSSFGGDSSGVAGDLTNVVAFANPFTDDRLVPLSSITLAASQASVTEDGSDPLTFTFTRTGPTDSELTVNYSLGGTATLGTDYSGIAAEGEVKTVTFTSGSATASVVLTTIADAFLEGTESIVLAIATGPGYITGNVSSVSADLLDAVNDGQASFSITGTPAVGQTLTATVATPDPDGNGSFLHTWQASADGTSWSSISSGQELTIAPAQEGQQLRLLTTYTDAQGFSESVTTAAADVIAGGDSSVPLLDAIWAGPHQIGLRFSEAVHSNASSALAGLFSVLVNGSARSITSAGFAAADGSAASSGPLLLLDLAGEILDRAAALSLSYSDPGAAAGSGSIRDLAGNRLVSLAPQPINHYITPSSNNSLGLGLAYDVLTLSGSSAINGTGNSRHNTITGNNAANLLDGGAGADTLIGGGGDDRYLADHSGDLVIEQADQGIDTVISSISWVLASHLEHLELSGSNAINGTGNDLDNRITGNNGNNVLSGGGGNDSLDGGAGRDRLIGSEGDDSYWVDQITDTVVEQAAQGIDTVFSSFSWVLGAHLENLVLLGSGPLTGLGNSLDNTIIGNSGSNILDGGDGGRDVLTGGAGADQFRFSSRPHDFSAGAGDVITDFNPSENDRIRIHRSAFGITASRATISTVVSSDAVGAALESSVLFVYDTSKGQLHWNQNGVGVGAGDGGVLAVLTNRPSLTPSQFTLV